MEIIVKVVPTKFVWQERGQNIIVYVCMYVGEKVKDNYLWVFLQKLIWWGGGGGGAGVSIIAKLLKPVAL